MTGPPRLILLLAACAAAAGLSAGCGAKARPAPRAAAPPATAPVAATRPANPNALLTLDEIEPKVAMPGPASSRPATGSATAAQADRPPLDAIELFAKARDAINTGRRETAVELLEAATERDPNSFELWHALGNAHLSGTWSERSLASLLTAARIDPDDADLQVDLGRQFLAKGDWARAVEHLRLAMLASDYDDDPAVAGVAELFLAQALGQKGYDTATCSRLLERLYALKVTTPQLSVRMSPDLYPFVVRADMLRSRSRSCTSGWGITSRRWRVRAGGGGRAVELRPPGPRRPRSPARSADDAARRAPRSSPASAGAPSRSSCSATCTARSAARRGRRRAAAPPRGATRRAADPLRAGRPARRRRPHPRGGGGARTRRRGRRTTSRSCGGSSWRAADAPDRTPAAPRLFRWSADHPDTSYRLGGRGAHLIRPGAGGRLPNAPGALLDLGAGAVDEDGRVEAARQYWVARVAQAYRRRAESRDALRRAVETGARPFRPAYRAQLDAVQSRADLRHPDKAAAAAEELAARAARLGDAALAAELRGLWLLGREKPVAAARLLAEAAALGGDSPDLHFAHAVALKAAGEAARYEQTLWKIVSDWPDYDEAAGALYTHYREAGVEARADKVLAGWLAADPQSVRARLFQVRDTFGRGRPGAAEKLLLETFEEAPDDPEVLGLLALLYTQTDRLDEFARTLRTRHAAEPFNLAVAARLVELEVGRGRGADAGRVIDATRDAVAADPDALYEVAHLYLSAGQKDASERSLRAALAIEPAHAPAANDLSYALSEAGRELADAERLARVATDAEPDNGAFLDSLGWVLYKRGALDEARRHLERAVEVSARPDPVMLDHLGDVLYRLGDAAAAAARWTEAAAQLAELPADADRDDLTTLRLPLDLKTKQAPPGQPVTVSPLAEGDVVKTNAARP